MDLLNLDAKEIRKKLIDGEIKAKDLLLAYIKRAKENKYNSFISLCQDEAIKKADEIDKKISEGKEIGSLAGLVISIKDNIALKGVRQTCASKMLENYIAPYDATLIEKIKAEDGIIIGKVNMDEFAMGASTKTSYFGPSKNPLNPDLSPGGSSGGSASSVAAKEAILSVGTDTGGSVRQPSSFCGLVGYKPTYASISRYGVTSMANTFDSPGVIGRNVEDVLLLSKVLVDKDPRDASSIGNSKIKNLNLDEEESLKMLQGLKIAMPDILKHAQLNKRVEEDFQKVLEILKSKGAQVEYVSMPSLDYGIETYHILVNGEISSNLARFDGLRYGHRTKDYDDINAMYIKSRSEGFGDEVKRRIMIGTHIMSLEFAKDYYEKAQKVRTLIIKDFERAFEKFDLVMCPTSPVLPFRLDYDMSAVEMYLQDLFTVSANLAGIPGISLPMPLGSDGLSVGISLMSRAFCDDDLLKAAFGLERSINEI
ncbi:Asp-tRNA(Asn)/Glu-tRNA(Gln) amidotransferase subunit GatA [Peptoniphilus sp. GNH]|nr:Asp-tRNA(Asn)/Glu-tRNA(Gln) amidotransferase subunit GatA [Peptoniphilus sp. GNH]